MSFAMSLSNVVILFTPQGLQKQVGELESQASPRGSGHSSLSLHAFLMVYWKSERILFLQEPAFSSESPSAFSWDPNFR